MSVRARAAVARIAGVTNAVDLLLPDLPRDVFHPISVGGSAAPEPRTVSGDLFLAIELVQGSMTDLPAIAAACRLPLDTVEEIAAAHTRNIKESEG